MPWSSVDEVPPPGATSSVLHHELRLPGLERTPTRLGSTFWPRSTASVLPRCLAKRHRRESTPCMSAKIERRTGAVPVQGRAVPAPSLCTGCTIDEHEEQGGPDTESFPLPTSDLSGVGPVCAAPWKRRSCSGVLLVGVGVWRLGVWRRSSSELPVWSMAVSAEMVGQVMTTGLCIGFTAAGRCRP